MKVFQKFFTAVETFFTRGKAKEVVDKIEAALERVAEIIPHAIPIVEDIAAMTPNKTVQEAATVFEKYIGPVAQEIDDNPAAIGSTLLNAATAGVQKALPANLAGAATSLIQTAVQMAVTAINAQAPAVPAPIPGPVVVSAPALQPPVPASSSTDNLPGSGGLTGGAGLDGQVGSAQPGNAAGPGSAPAAS